MEITLHREVFEGYGTFLYVKKTAKDSKWRVQLHVGRVAETRLGHFAAYDRSGKLLGVKLTRRNAELLIRTSLAKSQ